MLISSAVFVIIKLYCENQTNSFPEALYLATRGGGSFFGKVGSFEAGYAFDALVLDDSSEPTPRPLPVENRLERAFYLGLDRGGIAMKFVEGKQIV